MHKVVSIALAVSLFAAGTPVALWAQSSSSLRGTAYKSNLQPLTNARVQMRNIRTGEAPYVAMSDESGEFMFSSPLPGSYIVEVLDAQGQVVGMTPPFELLQDSKSSVSVVAVAPGAVTVDEGAGFGLFGLGPTATLAVLGAAGAAGITAVVATRQDASPSR